MMAVQTPLLWVVGHVMLRRSSGGTRRLLDMVTGRPFPLQTGTATIKNGKIRVQSSSASEYHRRPSLVPSRAMKIFTGPPWLCGARQRSNNIRTRHLESQPYFLAAFTDSLEKLFLKNREKLIVRKRKGFTPLEINISRHQSRQFPTGFTLIELLVIIAIIALLMAILMPSLCAG